MPFPQMLNHHAGSYGPSGLCHCDGPSLLSLVLMHATTIVGPGEFPRCLGELGGTEPGCQE